MMRKLIKSFCVVLLLQMSFFAPAQTDPGTAYLKHQWTFQDGTANDIIGGAHGILQGGATISNRSLNTTSGGYLSLPAAVIEVNTYTELTTEVWFKSSLNANSGNTMLSYFGDENLSGWMGANYIFTSPSNQGQCRLAISTGNISNPWTTETGINRQGGAIDDGLLHHLVSVITETSITFYVNGVSVGTESLTGSNSLSAVSAANAFIGKSGYGSDPTWRGYVNKYSIYNKALSTDEVLFLYEQGSESSDSFIDGSVSSMSFDELFVSGEFTVTASGLAENIEITTPSGINVDPELLAPDVSGATVQVTYDGSTLVDGYLTLTSGTTSFNIYIRASSNESCFTPLYSNTPNLIPDPYMNSIAGSWGNVDVVTGSEVYCGSRAVKISGSENCYPNGGSIESNSITWIPNATYRFRAMVKTMDGTFNMGVQNANVGDASGDYNIVVPDTHGEWAEFDATFTTGSNPATGVAFFNNCGASTGLTAFIDNWELYAVPGISASASSIYMDELAKTTSFKVTGIGLEDEIEISYPSWLSLDPTNLSADAIGVTVSAGFTGSGANSGSITLSSGTYTKIIEVEVYNNSECFTPLFPDAPNLISDPHLNDLTGFGGSGNRSINLDPAYSFCGVSSGKVSQNGSIVQYLTGVMKPNTTYRVRAQVFKMNPGNVSYTLNMNPATHPVEYELITTAMDSACSLYNQYTSLSADIYVYFDPGIPTAQASNYGSIGFGANTWFMWVGTAIHEMAHYFGSGTNQNWRNLVVNGVWTGSAANDLLKEISNDPNAVISSDGTHFWPHGINYRSEIENLGGQDAQLEGLINSVRITQAMIVDDAGMGENNLPVGVGVFGWSENEDDIYHEVDTPNQWFEVDFAFTTGETLGSTQGVFFNSGSGYIDNWEMYEVSPATSVDHVNQSAVEVYVLDNKVIAQFDAAGYAMVKISVYDVQGRLFQTNRYSANPGKNEIVSEYSLPAGAYIVKLESDEWMRSFVVHSSR